MWNSRALPAVSGTCSLRAGTLTHLHRLTTIGVRSLFRGLDSENTAAVTNVGYPNVPCSECTTLTLPTCPQHSKTQLDECWDRNSVFSRTTVTEAPRSMQKLSMKGLALLRQMSCERHVQLHGGSRVNLEAASARKNCPTVGSAPNLGEGLGQTLRLAARQ